MSCGIFLFFVFNLLAVGALQAHYAKSCKLYLLTNKPFSIPTKTCKLAHRHKKQKVSISRYLFAS